jgi:transposase
MNSALWLHGWLVTASTETREARIAEAVYAPLPSTCPKCGSVDRLYRHGVKPVDYVDTPSAGKQLIVRAHVKRFRCRDCLETSMQPLPDMDTKRRMTKRCVAYVEQQGAPRTYADLARTVGVDEKTIRNICNTKFERAMAERTIEAPIILGIDELTLLGRKRTIFVDIGGKRLLDMIDAMNRGRVERWLARLPNNESVRAVTIDMWGPYREAVRMVMPNAKIVVDKWHVLSKLNQALDRVRNQERRKSGSRKNPHKGRRLLQTSRHNLSPMRQMLVEGMLANNPRIDAAWNAKEVFYDIWEVRPREDAERLFDRWAASIPDSIEADFRPIAKMVENWRQEIFAYFDYPVTNAYTEAVNGLVKIANRAGRGYSFETIRAKALLIEPGHLRECNACLGQYPESSFKSIFPEGSPIIGAEYCTGCHYRFHTEKTLSIKKRHNLYSTRVSG